MEFLRFYGLEETMGQHVILSTIFWWGSLILSVTAYRHRRMWNVDDTSWIFLFLTFIFFGMRELGHFTTSPLLGSIRYIFGMWSSVFMASAFIHLFLILHKRKKVNRILIYAPFAISAVFPVVMLYISATEVQDLKNIMNNMENIVWIIGSSITIYTTYMLGTHATGGFIRVFMFFQFAAIFALIWKFLGFIGSISCPVPYSIREILETLFGASAMIAMYVLAEMLKKLSRHIYGD